MDKPNFEIKNIHNPKESLEEKIIVGKCPECNGDLVQRYGKYEKFYACSNYPTCKYIKQEERQGSESVVLLPTHVCYSHSRPH